MFKQITGRDTDTLILYNLDGPDLLSIMLVNKYFYNLTLPNSFWKYKVNQSNSFNKIINKIRVLFPKLSYKELYIILHTNYPHWFLANAKDMKRIDLVLSMNYLRNCHIEKTIVTGRNKRTIYYVGDINNVKNGKETIEIIREGHIEKKEIMWRNGQKHGSEIHYYNDNIELIKNWKNGYKHGKEEKWVINREGKRVKLYEKYYVHNKLDGEVTLFADGKIKVGFPIIYENGKRISMRASHEVV